LELPAHVAGLVRACWELGAHPNLADLRLRKWAHMLDFGGHFSSKSRRYSTILGVLRRARARFAACRRRRQLVKATPEELAEAVERQAVMVLARWQYVGSGYQTQGEAWLAWSAAAEAREQRRTARLELAMA
jgi:hypothetical protein